METSDLPSVANRFLFLSRSYFSSSKSGFLRCPLGGLTGFKHGSAMATAPPFQSVKETDKNVDSPPAVATDPVITPMPHPPGVPLVFPGVAGLPGYPAFPLVDMSSSQVFLNMVHSASATHQSQLENYLRGALKRPAEAPTSPLDLSASMTTKRLRTEPPPKSFDVKTLFGLQQEKVGAQTTSSPSPLKSRPTSSPGTQKPTTPCPDKTCPTLESIGRWNVDDVCSFVASIELCAEYSEVS